MSRRQATAKSARGRSPTAGHHAELLQQMVLIRRFEEQCVELYSAGEIHGFVHLCIGEEAVAVDVNQALAPGDSIVSTYREHGHGLVRGIPIDVVMAEMYGKSTGCSGGRGGSLHLFDVKTRFYGGNAIVGGGLPLAVGLALADRMRDDARVTAYFFGDGAVAEGEFHEWLNLAALWQLPVLFCCENNLYALGHGTGQSAGPDGPGRAGSQLRHAPCRWTGWTCSPSSRRPGTPRKPSAPGAARTSWSCAPTGTAPTRWMTRSGTGTRPRWSSGSSATRSRRWRRACGMRVSWTTATSPRSTQTCPRSSPRQLRQLARTR